jgi:hypothetical protein
MLKIHTDTRNLVQLIYQNNNQFLHHTKLFNITQKETQRIKIMKFKKK